MEELPIVLGQHSRRNYALRTTPHLLRCIEPNCPECERLTAFAIRDADAFRYDREIRTRIRRAEFLESYQEVYRGGVREVVLLRDGEMRFVVKVAENSNFLLTCLPTGFHYRTGSVAEELRRVRLNSLVRRT